MTNEFECPKHKLELEMEPGSGMLSCPECDKAPQDIQSARTQGCNAGHSREAQTQELEAGSLLHSFAKRLREMQKDMPPEFQKVVDDHFFDLLA